jgi:hypothetical protein
MHVRFFPLRRVAVGLLISRRRPAQRLEAVAAGTHAQRRHARHRIDQIVMPARRMVDLLGLAMAGRTLQRAGLSDQRWQVKQLDAARIDQWQQPL